MKRRPFLVLTLLFVVAALFQVMLSPASPPIAEGKGALPPGMVCTACGPIPTGFCELQPANSLPPLKSLPPLQPTR